MSGPVIMAAAQQEIAFEQMRPLLPPELRAEEFVSRYEQFCNQLVELVAGNEFTEVPNFLATSLQDLHRSHSVLLLSEDSVQYVQAMDRQTYILLLQTLVPDVLATVSADRTKQIRAFSKRFSSAVAQAIEGLPPALCTKKQLEADLFAQRLRRFTTLNHLAQTARNVLTKDDNIRLMAEDYKKVDVESVREQLLWASENCSEASIMRFEEEFRQLLVPGQGLSTWASWMQRVVTHSVGLTREPPMPSEELTARVADFQLQWSFLSSLVIRDLTLRSATSFGMFHLMRLLLDEYAFFLLELAVSTDGTQAFPTHAES
eukprot:m.101913 g.101913  ORF g.101913 m.101913 type:complete len:317 (+) comp13212_c0_seq2:320-1270(+)